MPRAVRGIAGVPTQTAYRSLAEGAINRAGVRRLVEVLGYRGPQVEIPVDMLGRFGLAEDDVAGLVVVGRSGPVDALLIEMARREGAGAARLARQVRRTHPARLQLFVVASPAYEQLVIGTFGLDETFRHLVLDRGDIRPSDVEALAEMAPAERESGLSLVVRQSAALERTRITRRFFRDFQARRDALATAWRNVPEDALPERAQLALLVLSRLTFLYFLQRHGALGGRDRYLARLFGEWSAVCRDGHGRSGQDRLAVQDRPSFYRSRLVPLFFESLNRRPAHRTPAARQLGPLPYLNGGLFEPHALECRFPALDLPDAEVRACLDDLLERYRFTTREVPEGVGRGVDPEVLGRVFEGLMAPDRRSGTGTFYTPPKVVDRVVREAVATYVAAPVPGSTAPRSPGGRGTCFRPASGIASAGRWSASGCWIPRAAPAHSWSARCTAWARHSPRWTAVDTARSDAKSWPHRSTVSTCSRTRRSCARSGSGSR